MNLNEHVIVLDLDDTLFKERDYVKSAFSYIANHISAQRTFTTTQIYDQMLQNFNLGKEVFGHIIETFNLSIPITELISMYREHEPEIYLDPLTLSSLERIKSKAAKVGLVTDGRSKQQRNKLKALGLDQFFDDTIISEEFGSEKPNSRNFKYFENKYSAGRFWYVGDNTSKDFITPNSLDWSTICVLDNGDNIHPQDFSLPIQYLPTYMIKEFGDCEKIIFPNVW